MATQSSISGMTLQAVLAATILLPGGSTAYADSRQRRSSTEIAKPASATALKLHNYFQSHFTISLPADWITRNDVVAPMVAAPRGVLRTRLELPSIKVKVSPLESAISLDRIADSEVTQWEDRWKVVARTTRKVNALQAKFFEIETEINGAKVKMMRMYTAGNGRYFTIVCTANIKEFPRYQKLFESVMLSFKIVS